MNDKDEELFKRYRLALERLTAMGSEYYNEPERCAREVQDRLLFQRERIEVLSAELREIYSIPVIGWLVKKILKK